MKKITFIYAIIMYSLSIGANTLQSQMILTKTEITDLTFLYEEEKLAYDVYLYAAIKYDIPVFKNISNAEQKHQNQVENILDQAGVIDYQIYGKGVFKDVKLQALYNKFTKQVDISLIEALKVAATIEDLDIFDLQKLKKRTDNKKILVMYSILTCGSENHIRAFTKQLKKQKTSYIPKYISTKEYKKILKNTNKSCKSNKQEKGKAEKKGKGMGKGRGNGQSRGQGRGQGMGCNRL